jgi:hypothetical protein
MARIGILTGGGDCPGLNAVIRAVVRKGNNAYGHELVGYRHGWAGVLAGESISLDQRTTSGILHRGGTILGTSRTNPYKQDGPGTAGVRAILERDRIDALIPIGGEDTLGVAKRLADDGIPVVGVPRRSTTISRARTSRSASRPRSRSPRTRSIASTPPPSRTTGVIVVEVMGTARGAGSPPTRGWRAGADGRAS